MNKKKKVLIVLVILIVVLIAILITRSFIEQYKRDNKVYSTIEDFNTPEDVIKYLGGEYIKQEESTADGFKLDIYLKFKVDLYTNGISNEEYYNKVMDMTAYVLDYNSFRLIDDEKEMLIAVICDSENGRIKRKYINGDSNYFGNVESQKNLQKIQKTQITNLEVQSPELIELINNNWKTSNMNFGIKTGTLGKYDVYGNEGIQVKNVYKKVFNIVFKENYANSVVNGIIPGMEKKEIVDILGTPTITSNNTDIFGYKGKGIYIFFAYGDISVYRVEEYESTKFAKLVEDYINGTDVKKFVSSITDVWPDYDQYNYNENFVNLVYTLKGIKIQFNITSNHGVVIYNNYTGQIIPGMTIENIDIDELKNKVFFENANTMLENEITRADYYEADPS